MEEALVSMDGQDLERDSDGIEEAPKANEAERQVRPFNTAAIGGSLCRESFPEVSGSKTEGTSCCLPLWKAKNEARKANKPEIS
jgi:hypothetical protein